MSLAQIRNPDCTECALHKGANTVCLLGKMPRKPPRVMVVGEAPGATEDETGEPFVGAAGQMLNDLLANAGISRGDVYVTNSVKCRPPANRKPKAKEVKTCAHNYLLKELGEIRPAYVLTLGNVGLQAVLGKSGITRHRGQAHVKYFAALAPDGTLLDEPVEATVFGTFHPAAILRNPQYREPVEADLARFSRMVRGDREGVPETRVKVVRKKAHLRWLLRHLMQADEISFDLETYCDHPQALQADKAALQEYRGDEYSHVSSISFSTEEGVSYVVPLWHTESPWGVTLDEDGNPRISKLIDRRILNFLKPAFEREDCKYIGHNVKYDVRWMRAKGVRARATFCTLLAAHALDENRMNGLKPLSQVVLGADAYDVGDELKEPHKIPLKRLATYNGKDTDYPLRLYHILKPQLLEEPRTLRAFHFLSMPASNALVDIERRGIALDMKRLRRRHAKCEEMLEALRLKMVQYVPKDKREQFNPGSPPQVAEWLFDDLGFDIVKLTDSGAPSTDKSVVSELRRDHDHPALKYLAKWRRWKKWHGYLKAWLHFQQEGSLYPTYRLLTVTGRLSSSNPNVQQVPRHPFMRSIFRSREGWLLLGADYSQIELRIAAMLADDPRMLRIFFNKQDIHLDRAARITGKLPADVTKEERSRAKPVSFGFLYGMGAPKFVTYARDEYEIEFEPDEAQRIRQQFFDDFSKLQTWHDRQRRLVRRHGRVTSIFGRTRRLPDINSGDEHVRKEAERQAINTVVQGPASDLMLLACIVLNKKLPEEEARVVGTIHDQLLFEVKEDYIDEWAPVIKEEMENVERPRKLFGADITVPIEVDLEIGTLWGESK